MITLLAFTVMLVDHVGHYLLSDNLIMRSVGRFALPLFQGLLSLGYTRTRDRDKYFIRIFMLSCVSQFPYYLLHHSSHLNICFTLLFSIMIHDLLQKYKYYYALVFFTISLFLPLEYSIFGIISSLLLLSNRINNISKIIGLSVLTFLYVCQSNHIIQLLYIPGAALFLFLSVLPSFKFPRLLKYSFYPAHLLIIYLIRQI